MDIHDHCLISKVIIVMVFHDQIKPLPHFWRDFVYHQLTITANIQSTVMAHVNHITVKIEWSIKGYHAFQVRPHPEVDMLVEPEQHNPYDPYAMKVMMPELNDIPQRHRYAVTRQPNSRHPLAQTVATIAGKQVGRVPANLCRAFRHIKDRNLVISITCKYTERVGPTSNPHMLQRFHRRFSPQAHSRDVPGGGAELKCDYFIQLTQQNFEQVMHILEEHVGIDALDDRLFA